jgi:N-acetylglucosamine-6-phosphate deacetylase
MIMVSDSVRANTGSAPRLNDGTLAGSVLTMDQALRNAVYRCSVPIEHALASATKHPASVLGLTDRGNIEISKRADLVLLGHELNVMSTISKGLLNNVGHG